MDTRRIAELLEPFLEKPTTQGPTAADAFCQRISMYVDILLRWNARINLTAIRTPEEIVTRHFGESLFAARHLFSPVDHLETDATGYPGETANHADATSVAEARVPAIIRVADLGSGAGFPGLPIKLWEPSIMLTLIESNHKKATFLREVVRALTLTDVDIKNVLAETLPPASFDLITLRAVERLSSMLPVAASLLAPGGRLSLLISSAQEEMVRNSVVDFAWLPIVSVPCSASRIVLTGHKN